MDTGSFGRREERECLRYIELEVQELQKVQQTHCSSFLYIDTHPRIHIFRTFDAVRSIAAMQRATHYIQMNLDVYACVVLRSARQLDLSCDHLFDPRRNTVLHSTPQIREE